MEILDNQDINDKLFKKNISESFFGDLIICWGKCGECLGGAVHTLIPGAAAAASADLPPSHTDSSGAGVRASRPGRVRVRSSPAC